MRLCSQAITILLLYVAYGIAQTTATSSASWISVGPEGGDVRTLSVDPANPSRLLLGTSAGQIYESQDGGKSWRRSVRIGKGSDFVIDHIIARQHGGQSERSNLALACLNCNAHKGPNISGLDPKTGRLTRLFHPRRHKWNRHFRWLGPLLIGRSGG